MDILVTGASGLIGSALVPRLTAEGHHVIELRRDRGTTPASQATWNPDAGQIDLSRCGPVDAVVHLAGENVAQRWTPKAKARIRDSRVNGTHLLCEALTKLAQPPKTLVGASATGFYGHRGEEALDEQSAPGSGFLAEVCREWEAALASAAEQGVRVVHLRLGLVLAAQGGALAKMLTPFRLGLGGSLGSGRQYWSWITLEDLLAVVLFAMRTETLSGPVNAVAPGTVTNREFTKTLGRVLRRPAILPVPGFALRLLFGEMADGALLASARVKPAKLEASGFVFRFPELEPALRSLLKTR
ncbi:MAG: TIGR01777 family protein [Verrucomicrobia bacterium]|nr:TIGR01777 family protein [Verrucomicrobiota bacterium]